ncbi:MAG: HNH endonuclease [Acidimicrobiia bacterium]|nr:HNH endonuclease [Acidimicrobiia bacterium]
MTASLTALRRGRVVEGETCRVEGFGDVPVTRVQELLDDNPFVKGVLTDGIEVHKVKHFRRGLTAEQRTALEVQGARCCEPGCDRTDGLEIDHVEPLAAGGPTQLANLAVRCPTHHRDKTARDRNRGEHHTRGDPHPP